MAVLVISRKDGAHRSSSHVLLSYADITGGVAGTAGRAQDRIFQLPDKWEYKNWGLA